MDPLFVAYGLNISFEIVALAFVSLGLAITLGLLGVLNLAHGEFVMIGAFSAIFVQSQGWSFLTAIPFAMLACGLIGWPIERFLIRPLYARPFDTILATWGLSLLLREVVEALFGRGFNSVTHPISGTTRVMGTGYPTYQLVIMGFAVVLIAAIVWWFLKSAAGRRIQAMVDNPDLASAVGIPVNRLARNTFVVGLCLAGLSGALLAQDERRVTYLGFDPNTLK